MAVDQLRSLLERAFPDASELELPEGASIRATERETARVEKLLASSADVASYVTYVGNGSPRFFLSLDQQLFRANFAQVIILTKDIGARERSDGASGPDPAPCEIPVARFSGPR